MNEPISLLFIFGPIAQLVERVIRNDEVVGSSPARSTKLIKNKTNEQH